MSFPMIGLIWPYIGYISIIIFFIFGKKSQNLGKTVFKPLK